MKRIRKAWDVLMGRPIDIPPSVDDFEPDPPAPDVVALACLQGLLASGTFSGDSQNAAARHAWIITADFYAARQWYANEYAPMIFRDMSDEDRAAVVKWANDMANSAENLPKPHGLGPSFVFDGSETEV